MTRRHGVDSTTFPNMIIDSGAVYLNYGESGEALLGTTRGGNTFTIETDYREMPVDGAKGPVKGGIRIIRSDATLIANFIKLSSTLMNRVLSGSDINADTPASPYSQIIRSLQVELTDYATNVAIIGEVQGDSTNPVVVIVKNALCTGNFELAFTDADESLLVATFKGHYDPASMDSEPWEIRWPEI